MVLGKMKKVKFIEFLIMALFLATSCQKESHEDIVKDGPVISLDTNNVELTAEGSSLSLSIKLNTSWTVSSNESWCRVCPTSGIGEGIVTVSVDENTTTSARMATITIVSETVTKTISVTQKGTAQSTSQDRTFTVGGVQFKMIAVEGGTFTMGATSDQDDDANDGEKPAHSVTLSSYSIGETEVTQALWQAVMGSNPSFHSGSNRPVECVSRNDCQNFIYKLNAITGENFRLPTEAEWEFAARGGNKSRGYKYAGSNTIDDVAWYYFNSSDRTHDVATKQANELGLYDMSGNVWEWCYDYYNGYSSYAQTNPTGPTSGYYRVYRGGGWYFDKKCCRTSYRASQAPSYHDAYLGFRLVLSANNTDISVDTNNLEFTSGSGNKTFKITSNTSWMISNNQYWCNVSPTFGSGDGIVTVSVDENISTTARMATITIESENVTKTIFVTQKGTSQSTSQDQAFTVGGVQFKMIAVEGSTFTMGATSEQGKDAWDNEKPIHSVTLSSYSIGETEVTQALWQAVMGSNPSYFSGSNRPVEQVSWNDCQDFITRLNAMTGENFRLPTEAEWEFAARGGNKSRGYKYAGSNTIDDVARYWENIPSQSNGTEGYGTQNVATKQANELGLYDMSGNVWEWCYDWYGNFSSSAQTNPTGPATGIDRVYRGGGWIGQSASCCRSSIRANNTPSLCRSDIGFRLALSAFNPDILDIDNRSMEFASGNGSKSFKITSNTSWTVTSNKNWCSVSPTSGSGDRSVTVSVDENTSTSSRTATITVVSARITLTLAVTQDGTTPPSSQGRTFTIGGVQFKMIAVEGGTFTMGATSEQGKDAWDNEKPTHSVTLSNYSIGETEVTQALWQAVMGSNPSYFSGSNRPVEEVSWNDCQDFISRLNTMTGENFRLPTEAEWEFAARGGNKSRGYKYAGSNTIDNVAWYWHYSNSETHNVATKQANELGLYDMSGNVWEWCYDWYGSYSSSAQTNPTGPTSGYSRVYRGGGWSTDAGYCRTSNRNHYTPSHRYKSIGFRLAL